MTALEDTQWTGEKYSEITRREGRCPICGRQYNSAKEQIHPGTGTPYAKFVHKDDGELKSVCREYADGEVVSVSIV